jgi:FKBP-type peptidyl-prolyl cis-trans isomerase FklB
MKFRGVVFLLAIFLATQASAAEERPALKDKDKLSYSMGVNLGQNFKRQGIDIDPDMLAKGLKDALSGGKTLMSGDEIKNTLANFEQVFVAKQAAKMKELGEKNKKDGAAFLAENQKKQGVKTLPSGLQYKVIKSGTGKKPKDTDTVTVNYKGTLLDGTEFDSSYKRGTPATFPVKGVIPGWTEALQLMEQGAKWQLFIPPPLAYGEQGTPGGMIGPNATLIFEVELMSIQEKK